MSFTWRDDLLTGITVVDNQHKELIKRVNIFLNQLSMDLEIDELQQALDNLTSFVYEHFMEEEKVMKEGFYPNFTKHKQDHTSFINMISNLEQRMYNELPLSSFKSEVNEKICSWLNRHIPIKDKEMTNFIKNNKEKELDSLSH